MSSFKRTLVAVAVASLIAGPFTLAQQAPGIAKVATKGQPRKKADSSPNPTATPTPSPSPTPNETGQEMIKVTIFPSRSPVTRDASYGLFADLENVSPQVVTLHALETKLVVLPEVAQPDACFDEQTAYFPARPMPGNAPEVGELDRYNQGTAMIELQPQEHYKVFWDLSPDERMKGNCVRTKLQTVKNYLGFVPGDYTFTITGLLHVPETKERPSTVHTYSQTISLRVGLSQLSTALAAFLGALFAYVVVSLQPGRDFDAWKPELQRSHKARLLFVILRNAFGAGLMGAAVTIVASRLSETQFPIKVSVNDFWGALTIGFFAFFVGARFILAITAKLPPPKKSGPEPEVPNTPQQPSQTGGQPQTEAPLSAAEASTSNLATNQAVQPAPSRTVSFAGDDFDLSARTE
jgi:hypothetical protein